MVLRSPAPTIFKKTEIVGAVAGRGGFDPGREAQKEM
jgi:hypothetical protein